MLLTGIMKISRQDQFKEILCDTIKLLCRDRLTYKEEFKIDGLIGITTDKEEVLLVDIKEFWNLSGLSSRVIELNETGPDGMRDNDSNMKESKGSSSRSACKDERDQNQTDSAVDGGNHDKSKTCNEDDGPDVIEIKQEKSDGRCNMGFQHHEHFKNSACLNIPVFNNPNTGQGPVFNNPPHHHPAGGIPGQYLPGTNLFSPGGGGVPWQVPGQQTGGNKRGNQQGQNNSQVLVFLCQCTQKLLGFILFALLFLSFFLFF